MRTRRRVAVGAARAALMTMRHLPCKIAVPVRLPAWLSGDLGKSIEQTLRGLYHLAEHGIAIEIRIVLHRLTIPRLPSLADIMRGR